MNKRGPYKKYLNSDVDVPKSTLSRRRKFELEKIDDNNCVTEGDNVGCEDTNNFVSNINFEQMNLSVDQRKLNLSTNKNTDYQIDANILTDGDSLSSTSDDDDSDNYDDDGIESELSDNGLGVITNYNMSNDLKLNAALLALFYAGKMTESCFSVVLKFAKLMNSGNIPSTFNACAKILLDYYSYDISYSKKLYCKSCKLETKVNNKFKTRLCSICQTRLSMYYWFPIEQQVKRIFKKFNLTDLITIKKHNNFCDIIDGSIYQSFSKTRNNNSNNEYNLTFLWNTDGISMCKKSKLTLWPVYLAINELPLELRFCIENVVIAGVSIAETAPDFNVFLAPIINELKFLEHGINFFANNDLILVRFFVLYAIFDKPARSHILNMSSCTADSSCLKCLQPGTSVTTSKNGYIHIYPYMFDDSEGPERTNLSYREDLAMAISQNSTVNGIKGPTILDKLACYNPIKNTCIDFMHSIVEGVIKGLFRCWFSSEFTYSDYNGIRTRNNFSLRQLMKQIDSRLLRIRPPSFVPTVPRSIELWHLWRAHEYFHFIVYYSLCVFHGIMEYEYYHHLVILVVSIEILLNKNILESNLVIVHELLKLFVQQMQELYPRRCMLSGIHELLHIVQCTREFGPLNSINCFQFEELNRKLSMMIKGRDLMGEEFIKLFTVNQTLNIFANSLDESDELSIFIKTNSLLKTSNFKRINSSFSNVGKLEHSNDAEIANLIFNYDGNTIDQFYLTDYLVYKGIKYTSLSYNCRYGDFCVSVKNKKYFGLIKKFVICENNDIYVLCYKVVKIYEPFFEKSFSDLKSELFICSKSDELFVAILDVIQKCFFFDLDKDVCFLSTFKTNHLFQ